MSRVNYIEAEGTNYDIGFHIGAYLKEKLISHNRSRQGFYRKFRRKHNSLLCQIAESSEKLIAKHFPAYLEELKGLADGSSIPLNDILLLSSEETILNGAANQCTTFAYEGSQGVILGHNEDWAAGYEDKLYVVKAKPAAGAAFISLAYLGCLGGSSVALNEYGIAFSGNSLLSGTQRGVPKNIILRSQIEARNIQEFGKLASFAPRAVPNHSMAVDRKGKIVSVEVGLNEHSTFFTSGAYVHTNHAIHTTMLKLEKGTAINSIARYRTAKNLISNKILDDKLAKEILRSHENTPCSICIHPEAKNNFDGQTVASAIVNLSEMSLSVTLGNPCRSEYEKFYLGERNTFMASATA
jgi:isopenicillin-N N-acyltransferase like protein